MSNEKHVYKVTEGSSDRSLGYWLASNAHQARRAALAHVSAKRLSGGEIMAIHGEGVAVLDAEKTLAAADQNELPFVQHDPAPAIARDEAAPE